MADNYKGVPVWRPVNIDPSGNLRPSGKPYRDQQHNFTVNNLTTSGTVFVGNVLQVLPYVSSPPTGSGVGVVYVSDTNNRIYYRDTSGSFFDLTGGSNNSWETVWVATGTQASSAYGTSGVEYVPLVAGQTDSIEFQFINPYASGPAIEVMYAMSAASPNGVDIRLDSLVLGDSNDPNATLVSGTVTTATPGNDTNVHIADGFFFKVAASSGKLVRCKLERSGTDTHPGDMRILDVRIQAQ